MKIMSRVFMAMTALLVLTITNGNSITIASDINPSDPVQKSPRQEATGEIDGVSITVDYGSPYVKGRTIWGGLEKYGEVWRAGANKATSVEFSKDVKINGKELAAGKYALFIIPNEKDDWVVIFNEGWDASGTQYSEDKDVLRISVKPKWSDEVVESLTYSVDKTLNFAWEKAAINLTVESE